MSESSRQHWQRHIQAQRESGLNIKAYARRENVSVQMLYRWRSQLQLTRRRTTQALHMSPPGFAQATITVVEPQQQSTHLDDGHESNPSALAPVVQPCRLTLGPSVHLDLPDLPSPHWLIALVQACQERC